MKFIPQLTLLLFCATLASCNKGAGAGASKTTEAESNDVTGNITFDSVPITNSGLDYLNTVQKPLRKVFVEVVDSTSNIVLDSGSTDSLGHYELSVPLTAAQVYLRVSAKIPAFNVQIEDNVNSDALYTVQSSPYDISDDTVIENLNIPSGWTGSYTGNRASAPFAILDTLLTAYEKVSLAKPSLVFPELKVNWSVDNIDVSGDVTTGNIGTSHFRSSDNQLYILGKANIDTDEFDSHIIVHEWGHYFEFMLGRSDHIGGNHGVGEKKDMTLAFGEGWGNALSGIILDPEITYRDSKGASQGIMALEFSLESDSDPNPGWFSEASVQEIIFDLYDSNNDSGDTISLGLAPIIDIMTTHQITTRAKTSIFSFINGIKSSYASQASLINALTTYNLISPVQDDFGTGETHDGGSVYSLPLYNSLVVGGSAVLAQISGYGSLYNDINNNRFFTFTATSSTTTIDWESQNSLSLKVSSGKTTIGTDGGNATGSNIYGSFVVSTVAGQIYTIRAQSDGALVYTPSPFLLALQIQ